MEKKKVIISYGKVSPQILAEVQRCYPFGFENKLIEMVMPGEEAMKGLLVDTPKCVYLIKFSKFELKRFMKEWANDEPLDDDVLDLMDDMESFIMDNVDPD